MKICFVTDELLGLFKNGGIGTSTTYLALEAAQAGHETEILFIQDHRPELGWNSSVWKKTYEQNKVKIVTLPKCPFDVSPRYATTSIRVYAYLRTRSFDKIIFSDFCAPGWACFNAKGQGQDFLQTDLIQILHSSVGWCNEANGLFVDPYHNSTARDFILQEMERQSYLAADLNVSPSQYMLDWTRAQWGETKTRHIPYIIGQGDLNRPSSSSSVSTALREIVFFGRLETRKGIEIFLEVINKADPQLCQGLVLTFLGRKMTYDQERIQRVLRPEIAAAFSQINFLTDYGQVEALAHLQKPGALAIIASPVDNSPCVVYECLGEGIPFLASTGGGIPELIAPEDRAATLFDPSFPGLAARLYPLMKSRQMPASPHASSHLVQARENWRNLFAEPVLSVKPKTTRQPQLSVVIPTYNRPKHLRQLLDALAQQTYKNFDAVIVDDGSASPEAKAMLATIQNSPQSFPVKILQQNNQYVGAARNRGVRESTGEYVVFIDDDNLPTPDAIEKLVSAIEYSNSDILTTFLREGRGTDLPAASEKSHGYSTLMIGPLELGIIQNVFGDAMGIYRRTILEALPFHERHGVTHEDWELLARANLAGYKVGRIAEALFWYRVQPESMTSRTSRYQNMQVISRAYAESLPPHLQKLPELAIALTEEIRALRAQLAQRPTTVLGQIEQSIRSWIKHLFG